MSGGDRRPVELLCPLDGQPIERFREIEGAVLLGCGKHEYPEVDGIPVLIDRPATRDALSAVRRGDPVRALAFLLAPDRMGLAERVALHLDRLFGRSRLGDVVRSRRVETFDRELRSAPFSTYRDALARLLLGKPSPQPDAFHYFFCRPSDPTFAVAEAVASCVRRDGVLLDLCCGSGQVTRRLAEGRSGAVVGLDESFSLLYLASRFLAPEASYVCARADLPLPFPDGAFGTVTCSDAFHDTDDPRGVAREILRVLDPSGTAFLVHLHNPSFEHPYPGRSPLPPEGYARAFEGRDPRLLDEAPILESWIGRREVDLAAVALPRELEGARTLTLLAGSRTSDRLHRSEPPTSGTLSLSPLYSHAREGRGLGLSRHLPSETWAREYLEAAGYLPESARLGPAEIASLAAGRIDGEVRELFRRRVLLDLPEGYGAERPW